MVYESIVKFVIDNDIINEIIKICVNVDRDELIKALEYDRNQYAKGYEDGKNNAVIYGK